MLPFTFNNVWRLPCEICYEHPRSLSVHARGWNLLQCPMLAVSPGQLMSSGLCFWYPVMWSFWADPHSLKTTVWQSYVLDLDDFHLACVSVDYITIFWSQRWHWPVHGPPSIVSFQNSACGWNRHLNEFKTTWNFVNGLSLHCLMEPLCLQWSISSE